MKVLFSHWSVVRINCFGEITQNLRALIPKLEDRPDLFIWQALKTHCLINTPTAPFAKRKRSAIARASTLGQRPAHNMKVNTQWLPFCMFPCRIGEVIKIKDVKNQTSNMSWIVSVTSFSWTRYYVHLLIAPEERPSLHQETSLTRNLVSHLMWFAHLQAFLVFSRLFHGHHWKAMSLYHAFIVESDI